MSNDMKVILEGWRETLKEYTPDHKKRKEDLLAPLKQKAQDKASRHVAQSVAGERPSGKVYPGTDQGEQDVRALQDYRDVESFMKHRGIGSPDDLRDGVLLALVEYLSYLSLARLGVSGLQFFTRSAMKRFPYYKTEIQNVYKKIAGQKQKINLSYKHPIMKSLRNKLATATVGGVLVKAAHLFWDDLTVWLLGNAMAQDLFEEDKK
jgi:hypothetical protein